MTWVALLFVICMAYLGFRLVRAVEELVKYVIKQRPTRSWSGEDKSVMEAATTSIRKTTPIPVAELPPESIAPNLRKPPKPRGGIGSRIHSDDNIQIQSSDRDEERSQSSD